MNRNWYWLGVIYCVGAAVYDVVYLSLGGSALVGDMCLFVDVICALIWTRWALRRVK